MTHLSSSAAMCCRYRSARALASLSRSRISSWLAQVSWNSVGPRSKALGRSTVHRPFFRPTVGGWKNRPRLSDLHTPLLLHVGPGQLGQVLIDSQGQSSLQIHAQVSASILKSLGRIGQACICGTSASRRRFTKQAPSQQDTTYTADAYAGISLYMYISQLTRAHGPGLCRRWEPQRP